MRFQLQNFKEINNRKYDDFIKHNDKSSFYHTLNYYRALCLTPGVKPVGLLVLDDDGTILASAIGESANESKYLPWISKRVLFYAPPLYKEIDHLEFLLTHFKKINAGLFMQVRSFNEFKPEELHCYQKNGFQLSDHLNAYITLKDRTVDAVFSSLKKDKRKGIRRASERYQLQAKELSSARESVDVFYEMQDKLYKRKRHALKPKEFFFNMVNQSEGHVRIVFAFYKNEPVATQLYIVYNDKITAMYTATKEEHKDKYAGDFLIWYLLKKGIKENYKVFDFGGGGNPNKEYSPRQYKERFGTRFKNVGRLNLPRSPLYKLVMFAYKLVLK